MLCCLKPSSRGGTVTKVAFADVTDAPTPKFASYFCGAQKQFRSLPPLAIVGLPKSREKSLTRTSKQRAALSSRRDSSDGDSSSCYSFGCTKKDHVDFLHYSIEDQLDNDFTKPFSTSKCGKGSRKGCLKKRMSPSCQFLGTSSYSPKGLLVTSLSNSPKESLPITSSHSPKEALPVASSHSPKKIVMVTSSKEALPIIISHSPKEGQLETLSHSSKHQGWLIISPKSPNHGRRHQSPKCCQSPSRRPPSPSSPPRTSKYSKDFGESPSYKNLNFSQSKRNLRRNLGRNRPQLPNHVHSSLRRQHFNYPSSYSPSRRKVSHFPSSPTLKRLKPTKQILATLLTPKLKDISKLSPSKYPNKLSCFSSKPPTTPPTGDISPSRSGSCGSCRAQTPKTRSQRSSLTNCQPPSISARPFSLLAQTQRCSHPSPPKFVPSLQQSQSTWASSPSLNVSQSTFSKASRSLSPSKLSGSCFPFGRQSKQLDPSLPTLVPDSQQSKSPSNLNSPRTLTTPTSTSSKCQESCCKHGHVVSGSATPFHPKSRRQHSHSFSSRTLKRSETTKQILEVLGATQELKEIPKLSPTKDPNHLSYISSKSPTTRTRVDHSPSRSGSCGLCKAQTSKSGSLSGSLTNGLPPLTPSSPFSLLAPTQSCSHPSPPKFVPSRQQSQSTWASTSSLNRSPSTFSKASRSSLPSKLGSSCFPFGRQSKQLDPSSSILLPGPQQAKSPSNLNSPRTLNAPTSTSSNSGESCHKHGQPTSRSKILFCATPSKTRSSTHTMVEGHQQSKSISDLIPEIFSPYTSSSSGLSSQFPKPCPKHGQRVSRPSSPFRSFVQTRSTLEPTQSIGPEKPILKPCSKHGQTVSRPPSPCHSSAQTRITLEPTQSISPEKPKPIPKPSPCEIPKTSTTVSMCLTPVMSTKQSKSTQTSSPSRIQNASPSPKICNSVTKLSPSKIAKASTSIASLAPISAPGSKKCQSTQTFTLLRSLNTKSPPIVSDAPRPLPRQGLFPSISGGSCFSFGRPPKFSQPRQPKSVPGLQQSKPTSNLNSPRIVKAQTSISLESLKSCHKLQGQVQSIWVSPSFLSTPNQSCTHTMVQGHQQSKSISNWIPEISNPSTFTSTQYPKPFPKQGQAPSRPASPKSQSQSFADPTLPIVIQQVEKPETILETSRSKIPKASTLVGFPKPEMTPDLAPDLQNSQSTQQSSPSGIPEASPRLQEVPSLSSLGVGMSPPIISVGSCFSFAIYAPKYSDQSISASSPGPDQSSSNVLPSEYSGESKSSYVPGPKESNSNFNPPQASTSTSVAFPTPILAPDLKKLELTETPRSPSGIVNSSTSTSSTASPEAPGTSTRLASSFFHLARSQKHSHSILPPSVSDPQKSKSISNFNKPRISNAPTSNFSLEYPKTCLKQGEALSRSASSSFHFPRVLEDTYLTPQMSLTTSPRKSTMDTILNQVEPTITLLHHNNQPPKTLANSCCRSAGTASVPEPSGSPKSLPERGPGRAQRLWARLWNRSVSNVPSALRSITSASKGPGNLPYEKDERWIDYGDTRAFVIFGFNVGIVIFLTYFVDLLHDGKKNPDSVKATDSSRPYPASTERVDSFCNFATI